MKVKTFFTGIIAAFALPWLLVIAYPFVKLKTQEVITYEDKDGNVVRYHPKPSKRIASGAKVYQQENCQSCHTQVIRNSQAGSEIFRDDWAGVKTKDESGTIVEDTRRESVSWDYHFENYASIGSRRVGPDLINVANRVEAQVAAINKDNQTAIDAGEQQALTPEMALFLHLYNPRKDTANSDKKSKSKCQANIAMFDKVSDAGQKGHIEALPVAGVEKGYKIVPNARAKALVDYLLSKKHDDQLPPSLDKAPKDEAK